MRRDDCAGPGCVAPSRRRISESSSGVHAAKSLRLSSSVSLYVTRSRCRADLVGRRSRVVVLRIADMSLRRRRSVMGPRRGCPPERVEDAVVGLRGPPFGEPAPSFPPSRADPGRLPSPPRRGGIARRCPRERRGRRVAGSSRTPRAPGSSQIRRGQPRREASSTRRARSPLTTRSTSSRYLRMLPRVRSTVASSSPSLPSAASAWAQSIVSATPGAL